MIVPLTEEAHWLTAFATLPTWLPPMVRTVVLSPHPDDETLGAGGLILRLRNNQVPLTVIAVTDGENCYAGEDCGATRRIEQRNAVQCLGVGSDELIRLGLRDSGLQDEEEILHKRLLPLITPDTHLIAPWTGDFHPDHEVCGRVAMRIAAAKDVLLTFYFFWTWHRGTPATLEHLPLQKFLMTPDEQARKREALLSHHSQLFHARGKPILPQNLLQPAWRNFEVYLPHARSESYIS